MKIQGRHLIVALLAVLTCLPPTAMSGTAIGQDANKVNIRTTVPPAQPGRVAAHVTVDKDRVRVGEWVRVNLTAPAGVNRPRFSVSFGDGEEKVTSDTQIDHRYYKVGHYDVYAWVEPEPIAPARPVPRVSLSAAPNPAVVGKPVTFNARLDENYPGIKYRFVFGDKDQTAWQDQPQTTHAYALATTYQAYVDIGAEDSGSIKPLRGSAREPIRVNAQRPFSVDLTADPTTVKAEIPVTFTARVDSRDTNIRYRFFYGDRSSSEWQVVPKSRHKYSGADTYFAYVEAGLANNNQGIKVGGTSKTKQVIVTPSATPTPTPKVTPTPKATPTPKPTPTPTATPEPTPTPTPASSPTSSPGGSPASSPGTILSSSPGVSPKSSAKPSPSSTPYDQGSLGKNWWKYLLIALLISLVGYRTYRFLFAPRTTFRPLPDAGSSEVDEGTKPLAINFQILLKPNVADGQYRVSTNEPNLVRSVRRENG